MALTYRTPWCFCDTSVNPVSQSTGRATAPSMCLAGWAVFRISSAAVTLGSLLVSLKGTCPLSVPGPWRIDCVL